MALCHTDGLRFTMRRTFGFGVLACPRCGWGIGRVPLIEQGSVIQRILRHLGLPTEIPEPRPARLAEPGGPLRPSALPQLRVTSSFTDRQDLTSPSDCLKMNERVPRNPAPSLIPSLTGSRKCPVREACVRADYQCVMLADASSRSSGRRCWKRTCQRRGTDSALAPRLRPR